MDMEYKVSMSIHALMQYCQWTMTAFIG